MGCGGRRGLSWFMFLCVPEAWSQDTDLKASDERDDWQLVKVELMVAEISIGHERIQTANTLEYTFHPRRVGEVSFSSP